jgi:hypothetical protein
MAEASSPEVGHRTPSQVRLGGGAEQDGEFALAQTFEPCLVGEANSCAAHGGAGVRGVAPTRFFGSFFAARQKMNTQIT